MLRLHFLNVDHGDCIVLEHESEGVRSFAIVDSNSNAKDEPRALLKLRAIGATHLNFAAVTHPHADHFLGMSEVLKEYAGKTEIFYTFPIDRAELKKMIGAVVQSVTGIDDQIYSRSARQFAEVMMAGKEIAESEEGDWITPLGESTTLMPSGFKGVKFTAILPPGRVKGKFFEDIQNNQFDLRERNSNNVSMALLIEYAGHEIILGGDGTKENWSFLQRARSRAGLEFAPTVVKLPHHGSEEDSGKAVLDLLFQNRPQKVTPIACISANGRTHPSNEVLDELIAKGIHPYCTNLAERCGAKAREMVTSADCEPELARFLNSVASIDSVGRKQPCQGDISITFAADGSIDVATQYNHPCAYRGEYEFLANLVQ